MERTSTPTDTDEGLIEPLVEEEDVGGSKGGHDPHQPAHVTRPRTQLPQIQPGPRRQKRMFTNTYGHAPPPHTRLRERWWFTRGRRKRR